MTTNMLESLTAVDISSDGMQAFVEIDAAGSGKHPVREELLALLREAGVTHGLIETAIDRVCAEPAGEDRVLVAEGTPAVDGKPGWIEYVIGAKAAQDAGGDAEKIDLRGSKMIHNVLKDQKIAVVHPPEPGKPGWTVTGREIPARAGARVSVHGGPNTAYTDGTHSQLIATVDGHVAIKGDGSVEVRPTVVIPGNVDFSTGNIDFVGSLTVNGDVIGGFSVKVKKSLEIIGNVEDALIEGDGNVTIRKGFLGHGTGKVVAGGNVKLSHILNQTVISAKDVLLEKESVNGTIRAGGKIIAPRAVIAGGLVEAVHEIEVHTLGSGDGSGAKVQVGKRGRILERLNVLEKDLKQAEKQTAEVKEAVYRLVKLQIEGVPLGPDREQMLAKLQAAQKSLPTVIGSLQAEKAELQSDLQKNSDARIIVHGTVHDNVMIEVNGVRKLIDVAMMGVVFTERAGAIEIRSR